MDPQTLAAVAVAAIVSSLTRAATESAVAAGGKVWAWLKGKLTGSEAETAAAIEAAPGKASAKPKIEALLQDTLEGRPDLLKELEALLRDSGVSSAVTQTAIGNTGTTTQIAGDGNKITYRR